MAKLNIVTVPSKILRKKAVKIKRIDNQIKELIESMIKTLHEVGGIGLAAPQVGELLQIVVIESKSKKGKNDKKTPKIPLTVLVNPEVIKCSKETESGEEGCLSVPEIWGTVERPKSVVIKALDKKGKKIKIKAKDLFARILQHEIDHLNGILFTDKADIETLHKLGPKGEIIKIKL